jgi:hypothetical protein
MTRRRTASASATRSPDRGADRAQRVQAQPGAVRPATQGVPQHVQTPVRNRHERGNAEPRMPGGGLVSPVGRRHGPPARRDPAGSAPQPGFADPSHRARELAMYDAAPRPAWVEELASGSEGGDLQAAEAILTGVCDTAVFFEDPSSAHEHDADTKGALSPSARRGCSNACIGEARVRARASGRPQEACSGDLAGNVSFAHDDVGASPLPAPHRVAIRAALPVVAANGPLPRETRCPLREKQAPVRPTRTHRSAARVSQRSHPRGAIALRRSPQPTEQPTSTAGYDSSASEPSEFHRS